MVHNRAKRWEQRNPGKGSYPGPFTPDMISALHLGRSRSLTSREKQSAALRGGVVVIDCPIIVPGSKTEQIIIGSLLGDGSILPGGKFSEKHCEEQKEIIDELLRLLEPFYLFKERATGVSHSRVKIHLSSHHIAKYGLIKNQYFLSTPRWPCFSLYFSLWYPEGKKVVPDEILGKIGPQALAWWYMGDGTYVRAHKNVRFASQGFTPEDNQKLVRVLHHFGLTSAKVTNTNYIRLNPSDTQQFLPLISEYVISSLRYKLGPLEPTYKAYNLHHCDPEPIITERSLG